MLPETESEKVMEKPYKALFVQNQVKKHGGLLEYTSAFCLSEKGNLTPSYMATCPPPRLIHGLR